MYDANGLNKWIDEKQKASFLRSILSQEENTLYSLKEKIVELERTRDKILYELNMLKSIGVRPR